MVNQYHFITENKQKEMLYFLYKTYAVNYLGLIPKDVYTEFIKATNNNSMTTKKFISWYTQNPRYRKSDSIS